MAGSEVSDPSDAEPIGSGSGSGSELENQAMRIAYYMAFTFHQIRHEMCKVCTYSCLLAKLRCGLLYAYMYTYRLSKLLV